MIDGPVATIGVEPGGDALPESPLAERANIRAYTAPPREVWGWAVGRVAEFGLVSSVGQAMTIFTVGFGLSPVIISWCVMLPRLLDGIIDPILGHFSDELRTPWGRRRPFMIAGAMGGAVFLAVLWWASPAWKPSSQFAFILTIVTGLYICYGAYTMAWTAVGFELSDDYHERSRIQAIGGVFLSAMVLINSWIYWLALRPMFGGVVSGIRWIGGAMAIAVVVSAVISTLSVRERFTHPSRVHVKLLPAIRETLRNRPFLLLILMKLFETFGGRLVGGMSFFLSVYYVCSGDQNYATKIAGIAATLGTVWSFVALPLVKPAGQLVGKRGALILGAAISFASSTVAFFITNPAHPYWGIIPGLLIAPLLVISSTLANAILPDICDVDEWHTGQRREGLFAAVMAFVSKLEISLAVVLVGYVVHWSTIDTTIGIRWDSTINGKSADTAGFVPGESAVFELNNGKGESVNAFAIEGDATAVQLSSGETSPTTGFHLIGTFDENDLDASHKRWKFPATTGRFFKIQLLNGMGGTRNIHLQAIHLYRTTDGLDALSRDLAVANSPAARVVAAQPPNVIVERLFWIVLTPGCVFSLLTLLAAIAFPLTEAQMKVIRQQLDAGRINRISP